MPVVNVVNVVIIVVVVVIVFGNVQSLFSSTSMQ